MAADHGVPMLRVLGLLALSLLVHPAWAQGDTPRIQGVWLAFAGEVEGKPLPEDAFLEPQTIHFTDREYRIEVNGQLAEQGEYALSKGKSAWFIDFSVQKGPEAGRVHLGIAELKNNELKICINPGGVKERPDSFLTRPGSGRIILNLKKTGASSSSTR
jgi:uncharacterized protein (TIGR03067 family)